MDDYVAMVCRDPWDVPPGALVCSVPGQNAREGVQALEVIGSGGELGAGANMARLGVSIPRIREAYKAELELFLRELEQRRAALPGRDMQRLQALARWAVERRVAIARRLRLQQGLGATVLLEVRDQVKYGLGGRTYGNILRRARGPGPRLHGGAVYRAMLDGAATANEGVSHAAIRGARFLRNGGRAVVVLSIATTAAVLLTASEDELPELLAREAGSFIGGAAGTAMAVGLCLAFGIATGGWGLLACGVVGGLAGGYAGDALGERLYYMSPSIGISDGDVIDPASLAEEPAWCAP